MRSEFSGAETGVDPAAPIRQLVDWLLTLGASVVFGLLAGAVCARAMRRVHVHWSWAALVLAIVLATHPAATGASSAACVALLAAAARGRRWHREDREAGADLAELASRRSTPLDVIAAAARSALARWREHCHSSRPRAHDGELLLGRDDRGRPVSMPLGSRRGGAHALIVGATGSGKTVTQAAIADGAIAAGMGAIVVDPKGDDHMRAALSRAAARSGRRFIEWSPAGPSVYNPYGRGSDTEIADKVLASERFTEPHYQRQAQRYVGHVVRALRDAGEPVSLHSIVRLLEPSQLELLVRDLPSQARAALETLAPHPTHSYLDSLTARQSSGLAGVRDRLAILAESDVGRWLDPATGGCEQFDLLEAVRRRAVVYIELDADSRPLLAQMLGGAIVQDLQTTVASLQGRPVPTLAIIDEFSALGAEHVVRVFGRARSAGVSVLLGTQELADLRLAGRERTLEQVLGNLSSLIAHRILVPDSASLIANMSGTRGAWRTSSHGDGRVTRTRVARPVLSAEQLGALKTGWAAVLDLTGASGARVVRVNGGPR